jgi:hypothetical protein
MEEPRAEGLATHSGPRVMWVRPRGHARSVDRGTCKPGIELRKLSVEPGAQAVIGVEGNTNRSGMASCGGPGAVGDPERARMHLAREPGDPVTAQGQMVPMGRGGKSEDVIRR